MSIKAIIASLVLGSSSVAMAAPGVTASAAVQGSYGTPIVRDHRGDDDQPIYRHGPERLPPVYRPVTLASGLSFANTGRTFITVGNQAGRFEALKIEAAGGRTFIKKVYVQFENGQEQVMRNLDRTLTGNECLTLDLDGGRRGIRRIVVYGSELGGGRHHSAGGFTVSAS